MAHLTLPNSLHLTVGGHHWWWYVFIGLVVLGTLLWATPTH